MKKYLLLCLTLCTSLWANAQATDLVVDCQTPGWLSSMINYGDQQTVKNLKVTGYINDTDLKFIGTLINSRNLNGELDLSDVNIVSETSGGKDDQLGELGLSKYCSIRIYRIPNSVIEVVHCTSNLHVDTLYFECGMSSITKSCFNGINTDIGYLYIGDSVEDIPKKAFSGTKIIEVRFPKTLKSIGEDAFTMSTLRFCNFNDLVNLESLGGTTYGAVYNYREYRNFGYCMPDTIIIPPKLEVYPLTAFFYKEGCHIFLGSATKTLAGGIDSRYTFHMSGEGITFHIDQLNPPYITNWWRYAKWFEGAIVYVPKGAKNAYENSGWSATTIIEMNPVEKIEITPHEITMNKGEKQTLSTTISPADADDQRINWISNNPNVVTVDNSGQISAIDSGETFVFAVSAATDVKDSCVVIVRKNVETVHFKEEQIVLDKIGDSKQLEIVITPEDATDKSFFLTSSNEQVCVVSSTGLVTATGAGTALITVTTVDGGLTATCLVKVIQHVSSMILDKTTLTLKVGETDRLQATVSPDNADNKNVTWSSSDEQLATVDTEGNVKALKTGEVWITATSEDNLEVKASCKVTITQPVSDVTISQTVVDLTNIGESIQLEATVLPEDATDKSVVWKTTNEQVCIASSTGLVVATGAGTAVVTVTTNDGGKMAFCVVNVSDTSGVLEIQSECTDAVPVFDTMGRRVKELKKGQLYIRNGKKFISR